MPSDSPSTGTLRVLLAALVAYVVGCANSPTEVRRDLDAYLKLTTEWAPTEAETARTVQRILATQFVDEAEVRRQIAADAPRVAAHIAIVAGIHPLTPALGDIHRDYLGAWLALHDGYAEILRGIDHTDARPIASGRNALEHWRATILLTAQRLRELVAATGGRQPSPEDPALRS